MASSNSIKKSTKAVASSESVKPADVVQSKLAETMPMSDEAVLTSGPVKPVVQTGVTSGGDSKSSDGVPAALSTPVKPIRKVGAAAGSRIGGLARGSTGISIGGGVKPRVSAGDKGKGLAVDRGSKDKHVASDKAMEVVAFRDATLGVHQTELQFRLIHFWEAWNTKNKSLIGLEMLLIDREHFDKFVGSLGMGESSCNWAFNGSNDSLQVSCNGARTGSFSSFA